jgi:hypothetical protein
MATRLAEYYDRVSGVNPDWIQTRRDNGSGSHASSTHSSILDTMQERIYTVSIPELVPTVASRTTLSLCLDVPAVA